MVSTVNHVTITMDLVSEGNADGNKVLVNEEIVCSWFFETVGLI